MQWTGSFSQQTFPLCLSVPCCEPVRIQNSSCTQTDDKYLYSSTSLVFTNIISHHDEFQRGRRSLLSDYHHYVAAISFNTRTPWAFARCQRTLRPFGGWWCRLSVPISWGFIYAGRLNRPAVKSFTRRGVRSGAARNSGSLSNQWRPCWALI